MNLSPSMSEFVAAISFAITVAIIVAGIVVGINRIFSTYPEEKAACESRGGELVRGTEGRRICVKELI